MNINIELFKRYKPAKKTQIIMDLTEDELMAITPATVTRIIKETGTNFYKSRNKRLWISDRFRTGNHWNSTFNSVDLIKENVIKIVVNNIFLEFLGDISFFILNN